MSLNYFDRILKLLLQLGTESSIDLNGKYLSVYPKHKEKENPGV